MNEGDHAEHDEIFEQLAAIVGAVETPPPAVVAAARAAFTWRTIDGELAELVYDSWLDDDALVGVRARHSPRRLTFRGRNLTLEVEVELGEGGEGHLVGQLVPPRPGVVQVRHAQQSLSVLVDRLGRFSIPGLPSGNVSLRCRAEGIPAVDTAWIAAW